ncbi:Sodium- and chloride-dependent GABA transporter 1, partial [Blomia tropicalis]
MYVNVGQMNGRVGVHMSQPKSMPDLKHDQRGVDYSTNGIVYKQPMDDIDHHQMIERMFTFINNNQENERTNESNNNRQQVILSSLPLSSSSSSSNQMMDGNSNKKMTNESGDSVMKLNPVGPTEFLERYRVRNSSQRPLVNGSFTDSSKTINQEENNNNNNPHHHHKKSAALPINAKMIMIDHESIKCKEDVMEKKSSNNNNNNNNNELEEIPELASPMLLDWEMFGAFHSAFLVPYLLCVCVLGVPLFLMEVSLGQYLQAGGVSVWNKIPILKGIGFASMVMIGLCNTYYIVIIAWTLYYLFNSFKSPLPWASCDNWWNSAECHQSDAIHNSSTGTIPPSQEFWNLNVLGISNDLAEVGHIQWHLFATLILAWIMVYLVIYRGIHQSGKIIWFTAMFPYVILFILFGYGLTLSGASEGIMFYITPQWNKLTEAKIWVAAGTQLLFTYGIGIGTNIALGSYNSFNHNFLRDSLIACLLSSATSLFSGFVIFSVLGHLAQSLNTTVAEVARSGPGLTFIVYPEALTRLPISNLWAILFFVMLLVLGIDSQFCTVESFVTGIVDEYPRLLRPHRKLFTAFVVLIHFILGISMITQGGMYVFQLMDNFSASGISLMIVVLMEIVGFCWIYGGENVYHNTCKMLGYKPTRLLLYFWQYISPLLLLGILIFSIVKYDAPEYAGRPFPWYGQVFGWIISSASIACIPCYVLYYLFFKSDRNLTIMQRIVIGLSDNNSEASSTTEEYSGAECD